MNYSINVVFIVSSLVIGAANSLAKPLWEYRSGYSDSSAVNSDYVNSFRKMLDTTTLDSSSLNAVSALKELGVPHRAGHASSFVRQTLLAKAREFMKQDLYGKPELFEPSSTLSMDQVNEKIRNKAQTFCSEQVLPEFESLIKVYAQQLNHVEAFSKNTPILPSRAKIISALLSHLRDRVDFSAIGTLVDVEVESGTLSRLIFEDATKQRLKISLPMLVSARTGEDYYFVQMLACFKSLVDKKLNGVKQAIEDGKSKAYAERDLLQSIATESERGLAGSEAIYDKLSVLNARSANALIDAFLVYNHDQYPSPDEWDTLKNMIIQKTSGQDEASPEVTSMMNDLIYFKENSDSLYRLQDTLLQEKERSALKQDSR